MTNFKAIITEKGAQHGQVIGNTKTGAYKGMTKEQFYTAIKNTTCFNFKIVAI